MAEINPTFGDCEMTEDAWSAQKQLTMLYNAAACETTEAALLGVLLTVFGEEHKLRLELLQELQKRGWYTAVPADAVRLAAAKEQFSSTNR